MPDEREMYEGGAEHTLTIKITHMICEECGNETSVAIQDDAEGFADDHKGHEHRIKCLASILAPEEFAGQKLELTWKNR